MTTTFFDPRAERAAAAGLADRARADAEAVRARTELTRLDVEARRVALAAQARRDELAERDAARVRRVAARRAERDEARDRRKIARARLAAGVRGAGRAVNRLVPALAALAATVSPTVIAFTGQAAFGAGPMGLGRLGWLAPLMLEGVAWRLVYARHQAVSARPDAPTTRLTLGIWITAVIAAAMNFWHGEARGVQVGIGFALASLIGFALVELLSSAGRSVRLGRRAGGWRTAVWRRVRYPRLSLSAASLRAAQGIDPSQAWRQAWIDRYGVGPDTPRRERQLAVLIVRRQVRDQRKAARAGELTIVAGRVNADLAAAVRMHVDAERDRAVAAAERVVAEATDALMAAGLLFGPDRLRAALPPTGPADQATELTGRPDAPTAEPRDQRGDRSRPATAAETTEPVDPAGLRLVDRPRPAPATDPATDVDVSDLLPAAREIAAELGDRLSRDALLAELRSRRLSVGGRRRDVLYATVLAERAPATDPTTETTGAAGRPAA